MIQKSLLAPLAAAGLLACAMPSLGATLHVEQGALSGKTSDGVEAYLGVPYAAPPTGANRWKLPQAAPSWQGTRAATTFASSCQQELSTGFGPYTPEYMVPGSVSEDCLYLNVWRPSKPSKTPLPILVWIPGGGYVTGSGSVPVYDGRAMAAKGVIVVNLNYRLGVFGYLAHPQLAHEGVGAGNYGIADILAALKWVNTNAKALGGDSRRITLAGQSAGSMAIHDLIVNPGARHLFTQVISESGPGMGRPPVPLAVAETTGQQLMDATGVKTIEQLRALPADRIMAAEKSLGPGLLRFAPVVDGQLIPRNPYAGATQADIDTPMLAGMNADEAFSLPSKDLASLRSETQTFFANLAPQADALYGVREGSDYQATSRLLRRERGLASTSHWVESRARSSSQPVYLYLFNHVEPGTEEWGAFHTCEVPYAFDNLKQAPQRDFTAADHQVASKVSAYWVNFVKTGNPNAGALPDWPRFNPDAPAIMALGVIPAMQPLLTQDKMDFYHQVSAQGGQLSLF